MPAGAEKKNRATCQQHFSSCVLEPVISDGSSVAIKPEDEEETYLEVGPIKTMYEATSFYLDASGRSKMPLALKFTFESRKALFDFITNDCIHPIPTNIEEFMDEYEKECDGDPFGDANRDDARNSLGFEVTAVAVPIMVDDLDFSTNDQSRRSIYSTSSRGSGGVPGGGGGAAAGGLLQPHMQAPKAIVEGITVQSSRIEGSTLFFETQVIVRAASAQQMHNSLSIKTRLHVVAVLSEQPRDPPSQQSRMSYEGFPDFTLQTTLTASKVKQTKSEPIILEVTLTDALAIDVTSITGPTTGRTLVSLVMRHPNTHAEPVTVTNIALHPGHSRSNLELPAAPSANTNQHHHQQQAGGGGPHGKTTHAYVADMSKCVQWGYAPQTQPKLPLTLHPQSAFATILTIDAMEHMRSRTFKSPVSVTAVVGGGSSNNSTSNTATTRDSTASNTSTTSAAAATTTISTADAQWTTGRLAQEPSDAFRIDMQLQNKEFYVGEPFTIFLRVKNLSAEARDMMLLVAKDSDKQANSTGTMTTTSSSVITSSVRALAGRRRSNNLNIALDVGGQGGGGPGGHHPTSLPYVQQQQQQQRSSVPNTAVVSEVNGYTFGVWGLIADADNPVFRLDRDQDLLAIDAALLLGEIKGHHSVEAQLRFNPLREGTLDVPNMQLFDKRNRKWYYCTHKLNIVARQKRDIVTAGEEGKVDSEVVDPAAQAE